MVKIKTNKNFEINKKDVLHSLDDLLKKVDGNVFCLARVAMIRALEIHLGSPPLVEYLSTDKESTIAFKEIAQGKVSFKKKSK